MLRELGRSGLLFHHEAVSGGGNKRYFRTEEKAKTDGYTPTGVHIDSGAIVPLEDGEWVHLDSVPPGREWRDHKGLILVRPMNNLPDPDR